jgi:hypothetical protein
VASKVNKNKGKRDALAAALDQDAAEPKVARTAKKNEYDGIQRKIEADCFSCGIVQLKPSSLMTTLNCADTRKPKNRTEAVAIAETFMYGGFKIPTNVYKKCGESFPAMKPQFVYSPLPVFATKAKCTEYSKKRDARYQLEYDSNHQTCRGGTSARGDQKMNSLMAEEMGEAFGVRMELEDVLESELNDRIVTLEAAVDGFRKKFQHMSWALSISMREEHELRLAYREVAEDNHLSGPPGYSDEFLELLDVIDKSEADTGLSFIDASRGVPLDDGDESPEEGDDDDSDDSEGDGEP